MAKGAQFERELCHQISEWWSRNGDSDLFWRTHGSGARATARAKKGKKTRGHYGDVCAVDSRGSKFTKVTIVSMKRGYSKTTIGDLMDACERNRDPEFAKWIREAERCREQADAKGWMIIVKRNGRKTLCFISMGLKLTLMQVGARELDKIKPQVHFIGKIAKNPKPTKKQLEQMTPKEILKLHRFTTQAIFGCVWEDFLEVVNRDHFVRVAALMKEGKL